jgi:hypothetical protein
MTGWPAVERDVRRALAAAGHGAAAVDRVVADLAPAYRAVERAHVKVDPALVWALVAVAADRARRAPLRLRLGG